MLKPHDGSKWANLQWTCSTTLACRNFLSLILITFCLGHACWQIINEWGIFLGGETYTKGIIYLVWTSCPTGLISFVCVTVPLKFIHSGNPVYSVLKTLLSRCPSPGNPIHWLLELYEPSNLHIPCLGLRNEISRLNKGRFKFYDIALVGINKYKSRSIRKSSFRRYLATKKNNGGDFRLWYLKKILS